MIIQRNGEQIELTEDEAEAAYRECELKHNIENVRNAAEKGIGVTILEDGDYETIARQYLEGHDGNMPDNDCRENLINDYLRNLDDSRSEYEITIEASEEDGTVLKEAKMSGQNLNSLNDKVDALILDIAKETGKTVCELPSPQGDLGFLFQLPLHGIWATIVQPCLVLHGIRRL